ncbi:putative retrotransposon hot spot (RHS) protein [Trypanosoma cruzi]|nr:putative retrotransposon hot spot (RHS) protein [Trypanosoma cruzi]
MNEGPLPRVAGGVGVLLVRVVCWLRGCGRIPLAVELNWRRWRWLSSPRSRWVTAGDLRAFVLWTPFRGVCTVRAVGRRILLLLCPLTALRRRVCLLASIGVRLAVFLLSCCVLNRGRNGTDGFVGMYLFLFSKEYNGRGFG